ncbi:MAG: exopolyphosphatase [Pseudomonadota bacterium]
MFGFSNPLKKTPELIAAVDLGSNSFHMKVARVVDGHLHVIDRLREMVRLGAGLGEDKRLTHEAQSRALACLQRFGERLRSMPAGTVRVAGTNTLRQARNAQTFLLAGKQALGHPIEIINGMEEARLIYLGAAHGLAASDANRLVVDIGGGSTELIIGRGFEPQRRESLHMGCVSMSRAHFGDGHLRKKSMEKAELTAGLELQPVQSGFRYSGWQNAVGCSGTIRAIRDVVCAAGWSTNDITYPSLLKLRKALLKVDHIDNLHIEGLKEERKPVFAGGVAILLSVFKALGIECMQISDQAMREGLLYDLLGRIQRADVRDMTVHSLSKRCAVDTKQTQRIEATVLKDLEKVKPAWVLDDPQYNSMLSWAARLHEIGLCISHSRYHKHGAYLIEHSDLSGFTLQEQTLLAALVQGHRRKFPKEIFSKLPQPNARSAMYLCILLRLAVLLNRSREDTDLPDYRLEAGKAQLTIEFPAGWLDDHPLTYADLVLEEKYLKNAKIQIHITSTTAIIRPGNHHLNS